MTKTNLPFNLSKKAVLAFCYPLIAAAGGSIAAWIINGGALSWNEIRIAAGGLVLSGLAGLGAYVGKPGDVVPKVGPGSDVMLGDVAKRELGQA